MSVVAIGLSFLEGLALIASPCILPVLPLVLSTSIEGGVRRPFGIIVGFVAAFTAFAMLSRALVSALGINLDFIKYGSLALLAILGLVMLSGRLSAVFSQFSQRFANAGSAISAGSRGGFLGGIVIGALIGLVWTPCAGPILAAVLVQIIREQSDVGALFQIAAFAFGAGVPMLVISLTGRKLMQHLQFLTTHGEALRRVFGVIILIAVAFIATGIDPQSLLRSQPTVTAANAQESGLKDALPQPYPAPELTGLTGWLNSQPRTLASLKGKVVLIDFWTYSCINCVRTLPYITAWDRKYRDRGLVIIGVHAPEFEFEKSRANVEAALAQHHIEYPVALDNQLDTWSAFHNRYWPAHYLIDQEGRVVYTHFGEGNYEETEHNIRQLLGLGATAQEAPPAAATASATLTPETYLGYERAQRFAGTSMLLHDQSQTYASPAFIPSDHWALRDGWLVEAERISATSKGASIRLNANAAKVFLVLGTRDGRAVKAHLTINGEAPGARAGQDAPGGELTVKAHTLYELVALPKSENFLLEITAESPGLEAYAFTFGS